MANPTPKTPPGLTKKHQDRLHREQRQTRMIVIGTLLILVLVLLIVGYGILDQQVLRYRRAVAIVNDERISAEAFRGYTKYYRYNLIRGAEQTYQFASMFGNDPNMLQQFGAQLQSAAAELQPYTAAETSLNSMVDNALVIQEAHRLGITVTDDEIERRMQELLGYYADGTPIPTATGTPAATSTLSSLQQSMLQPTATEVPTDTLALSETPSAETPAADGTVTPVPTETVVPTETPTPTASGPTATPLPPTPTLSPTPFTLEGYQNLYATVVADYSGNFEIPEETLKYVVMVELYRQKVQEQVIGQVACEEEQVWAQHILVSDQAIALVVKQKLESGEDWYALAAEYSQDTASASSGGDLGWFSSGDMVPEFEQAAFDLEVGQVSDPVKSQFGFHIIRVLGHENRPLNASECSQLSNTKFEEWIQTQRESSDIELLPHWETIYPLEPTLPADIQQAVDQLNAQMSGAPASP